MRDRRELGDAVAFKKSNYYYYSHQPSQKVQYYQTLRPLCYIVILLLHILLQNSYFPKSALLLVDMSKLFKCRRLDVRSMNDGRQLY